MKGLTLPLPKLRVSMAALPVKLTMAPLSITSADRESRSDIGMADEVMRTNNRAGNKV